MRRHLLLAAVAAAFLSAPLVAETFRRGPITVDNPWSRQTAPGQSAGGGFMTIANHGRAPDRLLGGSSSVADKVEVHSMTMDGGVMRMRPVTGGLEIPAGGSGELKPGGFHIMLIGLKAPLALGTDVPVTLRFQRVGTITVRFHVEPIGATGPENRHDHH